MPIVSFSLIVNSAPIDSPVSVQIEEVILKLYTKKRGSLIRSLVPRCEALAFALSVKNEQRTETHADDNIIILNNTIYTFDNQGYYRVLFRIVLIIP